MSVCRAETRQFQTDWHFWALSSLMLSPAAWEAICVRYKSNGNVAVKTFGCWGVEPCHLSTLYGLYKEYWAAGLLDPKL